MEKQVSPKITNRVYNGFDFVSHWLKNWHEIFKPVTKRRNGSRGMTFESHVKSAPLCYSSKIQKWNTVFSVFTRRHGGHFGVPNNEKFDSIIMQDLRGILPLF